MVISKFSISSENKHGSCQDYEDLRKLAQKYPESILARQVNGVWKNNLPLLEKFQTCLKQWDKFGLRRSWFANDPDAVQTLFTTRLIYSIVGFKETSPSHCASLRNVAGKIHMMVQGKYVSVVDKVKGDFVFSRDGGGSIVNTHDHSKWTYLGVGGALSY